MSLFGQVVERFVQGLRVDPGVGTGLQRELDVVGDRLSFGASVAKSFARGRELSLLERDALLLGSLSIGDRHAACGAPGDDDRNRGNTERDLPPLSRCDGRVRVF